MKTLAHLFFVLAFSTQLAAAQTNNYKGIIHNLYENILSHRKLSLVDSIVSVDYTNQQGAKGAQVFKQNLTELLAAFPDGQWTITAIIAEGNTVMIKQKMAGTHKGKFQQIQPTNKSVVVEGFAIYTFQDGKIVHSEIQTDRLGFLQQLGVIDRDLSAAIERVNGQLH
ncbi:ester cyclase [Chitinophaga sp. sic0106]|uniref:ester cyclase n=1 Tax=Chitinophaga sp. sic0106 TaxID=2854785 RepID=UPI001C466342|nr:ester cyclase [Chitinophaga sp. sic0106]MBV7530908.1 ester cyclase [Chitinophaga sp. sic0106]